MVVLQSQDEDHGLLDGLAELSQPSLPGEDVVVARGDRLCGAELGGDGVARVLRRWSIPSLESPLPFWDVETS